MSPDDGPSIVVFDGVCLLCNRWVEFLLRHDHAGRYRLAAMQSPAGRELLLRHGMNPDDPSSLLLIDAQGVWTDSAAIRRVLAGLGGRWRAIAAMAGVIPAFVRDPLYRLIARNRYAWFGRTAQCSVPRADRKHRFIE